MIRAFVDAIADALARETLTHQMPSPDNAQVAYRRWLREVAALARSHAQRGQWAIGCNDIHFAHDPVTAREAE